MSNVPSMSDELQKAMEEFASNPDNFKKSTYGLLDLKGLNEAYQAELKQVREIRRDLLSKKEWVDQAVMILEKRIEVIVMAMATLGMPDNKLAPDAIDPEARQTIEGE